MSLLRHMLVLVVLSGLGAGALAQAGPDPYATLITIEKSGKLKLRLDGQTRTIPSDTLAEVLTRAGNPEGRTVFIKAGPSIRFAAVQDTLDRLKQAGVIKVEIIGPSKH